MYKNRSEKINLKKIVFQNKFERILNEFTQLDTRHDIILMLFLQQNKIEIHK